MVQDKKSSTNYTVKIPSNDKNKQDLDEIEVDLSSEKEGFSQEVNLSVRVVASEGKKFTI